MDPIFLLDFVDSAVFFNSGTVTREIKSGKRDFQDDRTGRNAIAFRSIFYYGKSTGKEGELKGLHSVPLGSTFSGTSPW